MTDVNGNRNAPYLLSQPQAIPMQMQILIHLQIYIFQCLYLHKLHLQFQHKNIVTSPIITTRTSFYTSSSFESPVRDNQPDKGFRKLCMTTINSLRWRVTRSRQPVMRVKFILFFMSCYEICYVS